MSSAHNNTTSRPFERGVKLLDQVDYRLAETEEDRDTIYRLRYRAYLKEGAIEPNKDRKITDRFDDLPNSWIFGVYFQGLLASSIRISIASPEFPETPSMPVFPDILEAPLSAGKVMVDPTRFVGDPDHASGFSELPYMTLRLAYVACEYFNADIGLASVRAEHRSFYQRVFMESLAPPRDYPGLTKQICLMSIDFPRMRDKVFARYPYLHSTLFERRMLFERGADKVPGALPEFPCGNPSIIPSA
jgi:N-acyl amino acid synthase FeeM